MRGIRHTINKDLELLSTFLSSCRANLFLVGHFHRKRRRYQWQEIVDAVGYCARHLL